MCFNTYETWNNAGFADPVVEKQFGDDQLNRTIVTLPLIEKNQVVSGYQPEKQPEKSQKIEVRSELILSLIKDKPTISRKEISERLHLTEQQVRTVLENLKSRNEIFREGPANGGKWLINH